MERKFKQDDCMRYLEEMLGDSINKSKLAIIIKNTELHFTDFGLYYMITQALSINRILKFGDNSAYNFTVPTQNDVLDHCTATLFPLITKNFLAKYRDQYDIR